MISSANGFRFSNKLASYRLNVYSLMFALAVCSDIRAADDTASSSRPSVIEAFSAGYPVVVAHRGCWRLAPENSMAAVRACEALGVDMVEVDIRSTADGILVLMHDETLDRTTNLAGLVSDYTLAELRSGFLREGAGGPSAPITNHRIPTFQDLLEGDVQVLINLDIKETLYEQALDMIDASGKSDRILFKMRAAPTDPRLINARFHGRAPFMPILAQCTGQPEEGFCTPDLGDTAVEYAKFAPVAIEIVFQEDEFFLEDASQLVSDELVLWVNTLYPEISGGRHDDQALTDPERVWGDLLNHGVRILQTDRPSLLISYLRNKGLR